MTDRVKGKGFFLFVVPGAKPMAREEIERLAVQAGVDVGYIPKYPGDREMFSRAVDRGHSHGNKGGWIIRQITSNANECVCGVANAGRDPAALILRPTYIDRFSWKLGDPSVVDPGGHPIGGYVKGVYDSLVGKVVGEDWTECNR
ncbi:MAG: hypothetical protein FJ098_04415, partial [Deltaproteobacteria bacterium]|nr:hypothetical protein [Deltaproteobacteria bacterium]